MTDPSRKARFNIGDRVKLVGPGTRTRRQTAGIVSEIVGKLPESVFRFRVKFADGSSETFFGFELELELEDS